MILGLGIFALNQRLSYKSRASGEVYTYDKGSNPCPTGSLNISKVPCILSDCGFQGCPPDKRMARSAASSNTCCYITAIDQCVPAAGCPASGSSGGGGSGQGGGGGGSQGGGGGGSGGGSSGGSQQPKPTKTQEQQEETQTDSNCEERCRNYINKLKISDEKKEFFINFCIKISCS